MTDGAEHRPRGGAELREEEHAPGRSGAGSQRARGGPAPVHGPGAPDPTAKSLPRPGTVSAASPGHVRLRGDTALQAAVRTPEGLTAHPIHKHRFQPPLAINKARTSGVLKKIALQN